MGRGKLAEFGDDVLDSRFGGVQHGGVCLVTTSEVAEVGACAVEIFQFRASDDLSTDLSLIWDVVDDQCHIASTDDVLCRFEDGRDAACHSVDHEEEFFTLVFGGGLNLSDAADDAFQLVFGVRCRPVIDLGVVEFNSGCRKQGNCDVCPPGCGVAGAAEEYLFLHCVFAFLVCGLEGATKDFVASSLPGVQVH